MAEFEFWDKFPNLDKAADAKSLTDVMRKMLAAEEHPIELVEEVQAKHNKQRKNDFISWALSIPVAVKRGNDNACADRHQSAKIEEQQLQEGNQQFTGRIFPHSKPTRLYGAGKNQTKAPKQRSSGGVKGNSRRPPTSYRGNQLRSTPQQKPFTVRTIEPDVPADRERVEKFARAHAGKRGTAIGDRALGFSPNGTPLIGDSALQRSRSENLSANQAASTPPITSIPSEVKTSATPLKAKNLSKGKSGQVAPKNDALVAGLALAVGAALITAVMFPLQYLVAFFNFMLSIQTATSSIRNIASSMTTFIGNIGYLMGFDKNALKPIDEAADGMMNNVFGKEKVEYVKLQFAKLSTVVTAGANILNAFEQGNNALAGAVQEGANNTSKIGNALKASGLFVAGKFAYMNEKISALQAKPGKLANLNNALSVTDQFGSSLTTITSEIKTASEESLELEKRYAEEKKKANPDRKDESAQHEGDSPDLQAINKDIV
jgi:hypothetical protein